MKLSDKCRQENLRVLVSHDKEVLATMYLTALEREFELREEILSMKNKIESIIKDEVDSED